MKKVQITETVLRDANQSLMATRLPYSDYEAILPTMDKAGRSFFISPAKKLEEPKMPHNMLYKRWRPEP